MKLSTLAALSSCALLANGQPVLNDKRALVYETYVTEVVQTEYEFVTVWVTPGQAVAEAPQTTSSSSQHNHEAYHSSLQSSSSSVTPAAATVSVAPVSVTPVSVTPASVTPDSVTPASVTPVSVTPVVVSVTPASVTPVAVSVTPVSVTPVAVSVTPVSVTPVLVSVTPASVTPVSITPEVSVTPVSVTPVSVTPVSVTPVTEQPAPTSTAATNNYGTSSGGACGDIGGQCTGDATFYDVYSTDYTACGTHVDGLTDDIFAIAADMMPGNANSSPQCGRKAVISYNGKTATGTLVDKCPGCGGASIDLSHHLFQQLCAESVGRIPVSWKFTS